MFCILMAYIYNRQLLVSHRDEFTDLQTTNSGLPQGSMLEPLLYALSTSYLSISRDITIAALLRHVNGIS